MDIALTRVAPDDDERAEHAYQVGRAALATDLPDFPQSRARFVGMLRTPFPGWAVEYVLATADGEPAGVLMLFLPQLDNTSNVQLELAVHPDHRRRGVGQALHGHARRRAEQLGRTRLLGMAVASLPDGPARPAAGAEFAVAMGAKPALAEVRRRLDLSTVDEAELDRMLSAAWSRADGYSVVRWRGAPTEEYVHDVAYLDGRLLEDAPTGDLAVEPEKVDADRVRGVEAALAARGARTYHSGVRHDESGRLVAWTTISLSRDVGWHAFQQITIVDPTHRGHRLGMIVKIENLRHALAREPELRVIDTFNAAANEHMIAINEAMGFRPVDAWENWQQSI
jgi:GNAT superfamily N-acetyltransferase